MQAPTVDIHYRLTSEGREPIEVVVRLDPSTLAHQLDPPDAPPEWTRLDVAQCPDCPCHVETTPCCPPALSLADLVQRCAPVLSYVEVEVEVETPARTVTKKTSAQKALSSLFGLIMATSGCPRMRFLRPLARFHLPFSEREETVYRVAGAYLLAQYFRHNRDGTPLDLELHGLRKAYKHIETVNLAMATRLRTVSKGDATINAVVHLDYFAKELHFAIEEHLEELAYLFAADFLEPEETAKADRPAST